MEHGGAAPVIVDQSAAVSNLIESLLKGGFYHAGQVCVSVQRVYVHESMVDDVSNRLSKAAKELRVGDPLEPDTEVGPLILPREVERVAQWVDDAKIMVPRCCVEAKSSRIPVMHPRCC